MNPLFLSDREYSRLWKYYKWRMVVLKRDNFKCTNCGKKPPDVKLHVHHKDKKGMDSKYKNVKINNSPSNLVTLCWFCHIEEHPEVINKRQDRNLMYEMRKQGSTYQYIADEFRLSRQRVHQIIKSLLTEGSS